ncbi:laminin subunit alpha-5 [Scomber japonicus]|uniref:laminin subunit alpha-5 n=1 Tax=Scomber japonicus TaxID=13676 RepID=UPI0023068FBF|nr:laminin subunit alpha-5 [Scomber japonicus]
MLPEDISSLDFYVLRVEGREEVQVGRLWSSISGGNIPTPAPLTIKTLLAVSPQGQYCDICRQGDSDRAHPITNAIDGTERWWQSPPLSRSTEFNEVNVTLDLGQLFHVAYVLIKFANSPRPDLWVLERSVDFGQTYQPWQYFASSKRDCIERFGQQTIERINNDNDVICTTEYSRIVPLENGEIVVSLVNGRPGAMNFSYSPVLRDFTKATNIKLRFLRTNTLLGHLMGKALRDPTVTRRYYYSIKDISIGGRCVCNGHAEACNAKDPNDPYKLQCDCQHNTCGVSCDQCCHGYNQLPWKPATTYSANECEPCNCHRHSFDCYYDPEVDQRTGSLDIHGHYRGGGVCLNCQHHTTGVNCERCIPTYYRSPDHSIESPLACSPCDCQPEFTDGTCEDLTGRCFCKPNYSGENCDSCASGFINFPDCYPVPTYPTNNNNGEAKPAGEIINCECSAAGTVDNSCRPDPRTRTCICKPGFTGDHCDTCAPGFHGLNCQACQCSGPGCLDGSCDSLTGHSVCRSGFQGYECDQCAPGYFNYPLCQLCGCSSLGSLPEGCDASGRCLCKPEFQGPRCEQCRSGFHSYPNCQECTCDPRTSLDTSCTASGLCHCRPNYSGASCDQCAPGYYGYPSCTPCQCSAEGSRYTSCDQVTGQCVCQHSVVGLSVTAVHTAPTASPTAKLEPAIQSARFITEFSLKLQVYVSEADVYLTRFILRYVNSEAATSNGKITAYQVNRRGSEQSKQIVFAPSVEPTFLNVPQNNFVEPFVLNPGTWTVVIEAEGVLLDYLVLLPSAYYEAPILQIKVTEPCTYSSASEASHNCLLYKYLSLDSFPSVSGNDANCRNDNHLPRPCPTEKVTPRHPDMAVCSGYDISVELRTRLPSPGEYALVVEYSSEEEVPQTLTVSVNMPGARTHHHRITLTHCKYSFLCRVVAIDGQNRVAVFSLPVDAEIHLTSDRASFFLHKVHLVPKDQFSMEYVEAKVHCISTHGQFSPDSSSCVPSRFQTPSDSLVLKEGQSSSVQEPVLAYPPAAAPPLNIYHGDEPVWTGGHRPLYGADNSDHVRLDSVQNAAVYSTRVHTLGRYVFILHYHQPLHPTYPVQVYINGGRIWQGHSNASFCPHAYGCRSVLVSESQIILDVTDNEVFLTVQIPEGKTLWLDYVLVVPESSYSSSYLNEEPLDKSYDFISNCGQNSFYINPSTASPFCLSSAVSLSAFFNNGAMPCACHEVGAESDTCEQFGGQCRCKPHVIGRDCSMCATGYWGFPNCRPCNCGTRLCEPVTGDCICPPRTVQPDCTQCEPQTFGCHPLVGCEVCNCSRPGITNPDVSCDTQSGQCRCKNNIVGRQCDRCAPGFYGYPNCRPCDCNEAGTEEEVCDSFTGQCLCKENVQGSRCDQCRVGTFHLDPTNPKGCTSCFCFGATDRCRSSDKRRTEIMNMEGWTLVGADKQEVLATVYPGQDLVEADLSDVPDVYQDLHWHAPKTYLGDKVSSYGGYLRYRLHTQTMRGDVLSLPAEASRPDIILKGNQMTLVFMEREYSAPEEPHLGIVHMVEGSFRHAQTGNSVSREELMMVLVGLESLQIRALHSQSAHAVSLRGAVLEGAENLPTGRHANNVEICMCPANYLGDSCQKCSPGFYRDTIGLFLGKCVPCNCNGHSDQCLDGSGICLNCRHNTAGDHCEKCQGGFLGNNSLDGQAVSCSSCPCPLRVPSNNFAEGCVQKSERMQCLCMPGYAGPHCERCAPGFYGNPMVLGSRCQPCHCNGNTDPNMLFTDCHPLTGECLSCMHDTAGPHCDVCAPGYHGDAIVAKNCTKCNCSPCGTESCDPQTGQCRCKQGVTGPRCERCEDGSFGFDSCSGCRQCDCEASAALTQPCDPRSGQCACRPGVNGPSCKQCAPGHWDYGPNGCKKCNCRGGRCDPRTGECRCPDGMTGKQCDTCANKYSMPTEDHHGMHCEPCDSCVIVLLEDLDKMNKDFTSVAAQLRNLNASSIAWAQLDNLNKTMEDMARAIENYNSSLDESRSRADLLDADVMNINADIDELQDKAAAMTNRADDLHDSTTNTHQRAQDLLSFINNMTMDINDMILTANRSSVNDTEVTQDVAQRERMMREVQAMLREMRYRSCVGQKKLADKEKTEAEKLFDRVNKELAGRQGGNEDLAKAIKERLNELHSQMMDLRDALNEAVNKTARAAEINNVNEKSLEDNKRRIEDLSSKQKEVTEELQMAEDDVAQVNDLLSMLHDSKEEYERLSAQLDGARTPLIKKVQDFAWVDSKIPLVEEAERHAALLNALAMNLSSLVADTKKEGLVDVTQSYNKIINNIKKAEEAANAAKRAANDALEHIQDQDLAQIANSLKNHSIELKEDVERLNDELNNDLKPQLEDAQKRLSDAKTKKDQVKKDLETAQRNLNFTTDVSEEIDAAKRAANQANTTATQVNDALRPIKEQLDKWQKAYGDANATNDDINNALMEANKTVSMLGDTIPLLMKKLDKLQSHSVQMPNISEDISRIRQLIQQARNAASKVGVPMKFNGDSSIQVRTPPNLADLAAYTSLKFYITLPESARSRRQDDSVKQFVFYLGNKDSTKEFLGMALEGKRLRWYFNIGGSTAEVLMAEDVKSDGKFNNIVLERIMQYGQMSMSSEAEGDQRVTKANVEAGGDQGLLNLLTSNTVFYVGGYPKTFKPPAPLALPNFKGCIELETLNEEVLSLYNFENNYNLNTTEDKPCGRSKPVLTQAWVNDGAFFDGTGYCMVTVDDDSNRIQRFEQEIKLLSHNGILLLMETGTQFLCLAVRQGRLKVYYDFSGTLEELSPLKPDPDLQKVSDAEAKTLEVIIIRSPSQQVVVRTGRTVLYKHTFTNKLPALGSSYYLGGVPENKMPQKLKTVFPKQRSLKGCFRNVKTNGNHVDLKRMPNSGVSFGCDSDLLVAREAHFSGQSYLGLALSDISSVKKNFYAGFSFRTEQKSGLMFHHHDKEGACQVLLHDGHIVVRAGDREIKTQKTYNDDNSHYVAIYSNDVGMRVYMDDMLEKAKETIRVGREQQTKGKHKKPSGGSSRSRNTRESCQGETSQQEVGATHFSGSSHSFLRYDALPSSLSSMPHISMSVRINSSDGLVLYVAGGHRAGAVMSLSVSDGYLLLLLDGGKRKVSLRSRRKYNDEQWHTVFIKREGERISLIVDGINAQSKKLSGGDRSRLSGPLYIGGVPASLTTPGSGGFVGCVRDLTLNEAPAGSPAHSQGTVPCFQNPLQPGAYFSGQGGHMVIDESLVLGRDLEIQLEVRPVSDSGLLLHAGKSSDQHLSLVLSHGEVTVTVNSGKGEFSTSFTPEEALCNGRWHIIRVVKKNNVLQLHVDAASEHSVGPKQNRSAGAKETVYLGGVPDGVTVPSLPSGLPSFQGCIRKASINHRPAMLSKPLAVHGAVGTQGCPHM